MKILLIGINSKYIHPAAGLFQIVANSRYPLSFSEYTIKDENENILAAMEKDDYDLIGFSVYIWNIEKVKELIKAYSKKTSFLLGGPEASHRHDLLYFDERIRYIIKNEGEEAFNQLLEYLQGKRKINAVSNLYYKENGKILYTYDEIPNLKKIRHDLSLNRDFKNRVLYLEGSRGCPFRCSYCLSSLDKKVRFFDYKKLKEEILFALKKETPTVKFLDRTFNVDQKKMREIISFIRNHDNGITTFQFEIVGDLLEEETIELLQTVRRGQIRFEIGVQSTNPVVTRAVRRNQNFRKLKENIFKIRKNIIIHLDLIAGLPYEDRASFIRTFNETFSIFPDELQFGFLKELQGTEISRTKERHGYCFSEKPPYEVIHNDYLSGADLEEFGVVEGALNKYYNSNAFPRTMGYLFQTKKLNPYDTFLKIGQYLGKNGLAGMQPDTVALKLYEALAEGGDEELLFIIKQDYLFKPIRPKIWWKRKITREERKKVYRKYLEKYPELNLDLLYRYAHLEKSGNKYFLVTYRPLVEYHLDLNEQI